VNNQDMVGILAAQTAFDPIEYILTPEKHSFLGNWRPRDIRIDNFVHKDTAANFDILIA